MNNTITPHTTLMTDMYANYIATMFLIAWSWGLMMFVLTWGNNRAPAPASNERIRPACSDWAPHGTIVRFENGEHAQLYQRSYPSGKKAWRYRDECDQWIYPRRRELATLDHTTG